MKIISRLRHGALLALVSGSFLLAHGTAFAYDPSPGSEAMQRLWSPLFLAGGASTATDQSGSGDVINPAVSARKQRIHLDAGHTSLAGDGSWEGGSLHLALTVPTPYAVFTGSLQYLSIEAEDLHLGQRGALNFSAAKELYPTVQAGIGISGQLAHQGNSTAFGGGLSLGMIHHLGDHGPLRDLRWGAALTQIGLSPEPDSDYSGTPAPFTPAADIHATLYADDDIRWEGHTGLQAPSFQNLIYRISSRATFRDRFSLTLGWEIDLAEQDDSDRTSGSLLPSIGLTARFQTGANPTRTTPGDSPAPLWQQSEIAAHAAWAPLYDDLWAASTGVNVAFGVVDRTPPKIVLDYPETQYISPNNDGLADELLLPVEITDERYVMSWAFVVRDDQGTVIRTIENAEQRPENVGFQSFLDRILYVRTGVAVPARIRWDGRTDAGGVAPDGEYTFTVEATDDNANRAVSREKPIVVDTTPPEVTIIPPEDTDELIFAPGGIGGQDTVTINQTSSREDLWTVQILDASDTVILEKEFHETDLEPFVWDGRDSSGSIVPDGVYWYQATATDRAMNTGKGQLENIIVDTVPTPIGLAVNLSHFSPNGNGRQDEIILTPDIPIREGIRTHTLEILDETGRSRRTMAGGEQVPSRWIFDGRDDRGRALEEGTYQARLTLLYRNGSEPRTASPSFVLDITPPRLSVVAEDDIFSPNGNGRKDTIAFIQDTEEALWWEGRIENAYGEVTRTFRWEGRPAERLLWDGRSGQGTPLPDGEYRYILTGQDRAGNRANSRAITFTLDTRETPVFVSTSRDAFAPGTRGPHPTMDLLPHIEDPRGAERFFLEVLDGEETLMARIDGAGAPDESYRWDGRGTTGEFVPDGTYRVRLVVEYRHGNRPAALSAPFEVDTVPPQATVTLGDDERAFSPGGDDAKDTMPILQSSSRESLWTRWIEDTQGRKLRTWETSGELQDFSWDGTDQDGQVVPDGTYRYGVSATDAAGNSLTLRTPPFRTDTRDVEIQLRLSHPAFSPNGRGGRETVTLLPRSNIEDGITRWTLRILPGQGQPGQEDQSVRTVDGTGALEPFVWDGRNDQGNPVPDGEYRGELAVRFATGAHPRVRSIRTVLVDRIPPEATAQFSSEIISPDGDGRLDELIISQETSREDRWTGTLRDEEGRIIRQWEWTGHAPEELVFSGLDQERRRVPDGLYTYELAATDLAGNTGGTGQIPFEVYTAETPLDLYAGRRAFSPNGNGVHDTITFSYRKGDARGLEQYTFTITDTATARPVVQRSGTSLPEDFLWDGTTPEGPADEGTYQATLTLLYRHGNRPEARSETVTLDITPPELSLSADHTVFAPGQGSQRDRITVTQTSDPAEGWEGRILDDQGEQIRRFTWSSQADSFTWDGTDAAGNQVPDGIYRYEISGTDAAGNTTRGEIPLIEVDTVPARLFVTLDRRIFAPRGPREESRELSIGTITSRVEGAAYRLVEILDEQDRVVRTLRSDQVLPRETLRWDGTREDGTIQDGTYRVRYRLALRNGTFPQVISPTVVVDTTPPDISAELEGLPFSPDNDGINDELTILLSARDASGIESWRFEILDRNQRPFQEFRGTGSPRERLIWDGRSASGELVRSAEDYPYRFSVTDRAGNESTVTGIIPVDILVVRDGDRLLIQIANITFEPNSPRLQINPATDTGAKNIEVLDRLVEIFDRYQTYRIQVEGHAVNITGTEREERETLTPLSRSRAASVRDALVSRGMDTDRITIVGRGGTEPVVPHSDLENRWQNRRVDFVLIR
ncbi:Ig-like domain (group 3) [Alkalispirochaeta americana]|uniref:Ig-like domain (Group 3) n=1 Tax=Alkalispirochaeta americana TaxID=159291 RepID=A0A1N6PQX7_9SPIO|nr:FlgD immunoglobulin-like domain containing protein [Alkalispirochaeta americana]SIQ06723.1 Ig-like domain (group 3) [Alkalispirochaeta americana]